MSEEEKKKLGISSLPSTLGEAIAALDDDTFIRQIYGDTFVDQYLAVKKAEWMEYMPQVFEWEVEKYLYRI